MKLLEIKKSDKKQKQNQDSRTKVRKQLKKKPLKMVDRGVGSFIYD